MGDGMKENRQKDKAKINGFIRLISKVKIGTRVRTMVLLIICAVAIPVVMLVIEANRFMNTYNKVLENLESIRYIMSSTEQQGDRILGYCVVGKSIKDSGETEIIVRMQNQIKKIRDNLSTATDYKQNIEKLDTVENLLNNYVDNYKEGLSLCGDSFSLAGDMKFYSMVDTAEYLSKNCNEFLSLELQRSANLKKEIVSDFQTSIITILVISIIIIAVAVVLSIAITRSITVPIKVLRKKISVIAKGDLSGNPINLETKDELKEVSDAFNAMKDSLKGILEKVSDVSGEIEESVDFVTSRVGDNSARSEQLSATMDLVMQRMEDQNGETKSAQERIGEISRVSERMSENADRIMENAEKSLQDSKAGNSNMELYTSQLQDVNAIMSQVSDVVRELDESTGEMNAIIQTITDIAEQTNLLSLNASIEAARAGEHGKGFAVVASEIGSLAENSNASAKKIGDIIKEVQENAQQMTEKMNIGLKRLDKGNQIAQDTMRSFDNIQQGIELVNQNVQEILQDITELSQFVQVIFESIDSVHKVTDENTSVTTEIVDSVHEEAENLEKVTKIMIELSERAKQLEDTVAQFKLN